MGIVQKAYHYVKEMNNDTPKAKKNLLKYLEELKNLESKLWGVTIKHVSHQEELVLEDTNHLIYLVTRNGDLELEKKLSEKQVEHFAQDLKNLREDFSYLKRKIKEKNKLRDLISNYTILLVEHKNYKKLEKIFLLEKQLYEVIDKQEEEFDKILKEGSHLKVDGTNKTEVFIQSLKELRTILAGHIDHHSLWDEERYGYSNTSNILHSLHKLVDETIKE